jgi:hypothetical protein
VERGAEGRRGETGKQSRGGSGARKKKGEELIQGLICKIREKQGPDCKELATFKPVLKWRWSKKQKCIVSQTLQLLFKVHLQLSNSFEDILDLVKFSHFM